MLHRQRVLEAFQSQTEAFIREDNARADALTGYRLKLQELEAMGPQDALQKLSPDISPGAVPTSELSRGLIHTFEKRWGNAEEAREWAMEILQGVTTIGVDGSQLAPSKEYGVPVGLVQVAWFENHHNGERPYIRDARLEILGSGDLTRHGEMRSVEDRLFHGEAVNQRRFVLELEQVEQCLTSIPPQPLPLVLFDGSLVVSFASQMRDESREVYVRPMVRVLAASANQSVPLVGYIDSSYAHDLVHMLDYLDDMGRDGTPPLVFDTLLLEDQMQPLDRTCAFICGRGDVLKEYVDANTGVDYSDQICFVYLRSGAFHRPARVEFPRWILEEGRLERVIDLVRAEIIIGSGYPYPLETADATAVLTTKDRMTFYRMFQDFAGHRGFHSVGTAKMSSKRRRR